MTSSCKYLFGLLALGMATSASAVVIDATADTYVFNRNPDTIYGANSTIVASNDAGSFDVPKLDDRWAIMRFDISSATEAVTSASLALEQVSGSAADFVIYGVPDLGADEFFDQSTYTFNTSAYSVTSSGSGHDGSLDKALLVELGTFSTTGAESISLNTAELLAFINADTNDMVTLILYQSTQDKNPRSFNSIEATSGQIPQLTLTTIPEPTTYGMLLGLAGVAYAFMKRRRR